MGIYEYTTRRYLDGKEKDEKEKGVRIILEQQARILLHTANPKHTRVK